MALQMAAVPPLPLSSIVINDTPEVSIPNVVNLSPFFTNSRKEVCKMLELRAVYRLAAAFLCVVAEHGLTPLVRSLHMQRLIIIYR